MKEFHVDGYGYCNDGPDDLNPYTRDWPGGTLVLLSEVRPLMIEWRTDKPSKEGYYLATVNGSNRYVAELWFNPVNDTWWSGCSERWIRPCVIAWAPLPQPYVAPT